MKIFQSTPSLRKATVEFKREGNIPVISIHTFLAEGDNLSGGLDTEKGISIHTFLAEGDYNNFESAGEYTISIHTFLAEGDLTTVSPLFRAEEFQSTPSLRKATNVDWDHWFCFFVFQSTPSLRKATYRGQVQELILQTFQSTPSLRKAT